MVKVETKKIPVSEINFDACGPLCESRVEMLDKSFSNSWTEEDKKQIKDSFKDYKGREDAKEAFIDANMRKFTCCICGCDFIDWTGNNPYPFADGEKYTCCHDCNRRFVLPARLGELEIEQ